MVTPFWAILKVITDRFLRESGYESVSIQKFWESNQGEIITGIKGLSLLELNSSAVNPKYYSQQQRIALCERDGSARQTNYHSQRMPFFGLFILQEEIRKVITDRFLRNSG